MASPWTTYTPHPLPTRDVKSSNLADNTGHARHSPSVSSIVPFTSTNGSDTESIGKATPVVVSATSFGFRLREAGPSTLTSVDPDKQHASTPLPAPHSPLSNDAEQHAPTSEGTDIAAAHLVGSIPPIHKQVVEPQSLSSSSMFERDVLASHLTKPTPAVAPISAANNETPPSPSNTTPYPITTGDISFTSSPDTGASQSPTVNLTLTRSLELGRGKSDKRVPKRSVTGGTSGTASIVQSKYTDMVFESVPRTHNLLSSLFTWILLAGFVVLPGTFSTLEGIQSNSGEFEKVLHTIRNLPLYVHSVRPVHSDT
jgi:hypothetical protein